MITRIVQLGCDGGCGKAWPAAFDELDSGAKQRASAKAAGWSCYPGNDRCPDCRPKGRDPQPCPSESRWKAHRKRKEECGACHAYMLNVWRERDRARGIGPKRRAAGVR